MLILTAAMTASAQGSKWRAFEGYFQNPGNKEQVVRFTAGDSVLVARLLWNNGEIHLIPDTGTAFVSKEQEDGGPIHIHFIRDASGAVNQVRVMDKEIWTRAVNYKPVVRNEMAHSPQQLQVFTGLYQFTQDTTSYVLLSVENNSLTIHQQWDGGSISGFVPESELNFFNKERPALTLNFSRDGSGQIARFIAFGRDTWVRTGKPTFDPVLFKSYEGRYQSKDDPDNEVQLVATDTGIVVRQLWDRKEIRMGALTNSYFYNEPRRLSLHIVTDGTSKKVKAILLMGEYFNKVEP